MVLRLKPILSRRSSLSFYLKCTILILIIYYLNLLFGLTYYIWSEKSFEEDYNAQMIHIDPVKTEDDPEAILGPPKNTLSTQFLISNEYLCARSLDPETQLYPHILILVKSSSDNFRERQAIRSTWGDRNRLKTKGDFRLAFVLGTDVHNRSVEDEANKYGDIIQIDKNDYYYYSSYKMIMMLRWITSYCASQSHRTSYLDLRNYVLFVDDDYYVDTDALLSYVNRLNRDPDITTYERRTFITGEVIEQSRPHRSASDRYFVSLNDYPYDRYPAYVSSGCFLMTRYNARLFYIASKYVRLFSFDHIYMALIAYSMSINPIPNNDLFLTSVSLSISDKILSAKWRNIFKKKDDLHTRKPPICMHGYSAEKLIDVWEFIQRMNITA
ncbi:unnamed protein product [Adineta ricciae]|uniref:Hexosyltransferase n=1 Tax=Adineta ricciae TaxID=249248 RepID=A0A816EMB1_ADIRI|nr:unnamed protein product [Adineta ricciae]